MTDLINTMENTMINDAAMITDKRITKSGEVDRRHENPGRPETFDDKWAIVEALNIIKDAKGFYHYNAPRAPISRNLILQLVEKGFVETHKAKVTEGPGRAKIFYRLTGKAFGWLALSSRWKN